MSTLFNTKMKQKFKKQKYALIRYWLENRLVSDKRVIAAFEKIPRENFVTEEQLEHAYEDYPLPILGGQTISQPTTVAIMLEALSLKETDRVLEIGAGSGYNATLIAAICKKGFVYSTEIIPELASFAKENLKKTNIKNAEVVLADGSFGYAEHEPYDKIISTAAVPEIPRAWVEQLKIGGIIVAPVGPVHSQEMLKIKKQKNKLDIESLGSFMFVPLKGKYGY